MLTTLLVAPLFIAASAVAHPAVQRRADVSLSQWSSSGLESYWRFKVRYNSLNCASQSGTDFYTNCCSPLGASDSLSDRPAECTPATLTCDGSTFSSFSAPTPTPDAPSSNNDNTNTNTDTNNNYTDVYDESSLPYCEPGQDEYDDEEYEAASASNNNGASTSPDTNADANTPQPTETGNNDNNNNNNNNNGGGSSGNAVTGGFATYYFQNGNAGACGDFHGDGDMIGAIEQSWYGNLGQKSQYCGRSVRVTNTNNGKYVDIIVADVCPTCTNTQSFDLSQGAFNQIATEAEGMVPISWAFN